MENIARYIILAGVILIIIGGVVFAAAKLNLPLGRLPGDIHIEGPNGSFYFPLVTCIIISIILTVALNWIGRFWNK